MDTDYLRTATRSEHEATEATVPLMDPSLTRAQYITALHGVLRAVGTWDAWAANHCPAALSPLLDGRRRSELLRADLNHLGSVAEDAPPLHGVPWFSLTAPNESEFEAMFLGAMYVVEGSTLGGQYIARHVEETLKLSPGCGNAYFRGYADSTGSMWKTFKAALAAVPEEYTSLVVDSAKRMFAFFAAQMNEAPSGTEKINRELRSTP